MDSTLAIFLGLAVGAVLGGFGGLFFARSRASQAESTLSADKARLEGELKQVDALKEQVDRRDAEIGALNARLTTVKSTCAEAEQRANSAEREKNEAISREREHFDEQKKLLTDTEKLLGEKFNDISLKSLKLAQESFLETANQKLEGTTKEAAKEMEKRQQAFEHLVKPIAESLEKLDKQSAVMDQGIKTLSKETDQLANALRKPVARGDWGEMLLIKILENCGMVEGQHFEIEHSTEGEEGRRRADVVLHLPNKRDIIIDAKTPMEAYSEGANASDENVRRERFAHHAKLVKEHIRALSSKKYWERYSKSADFVILFLPTEGCYQAAIEADASLLSEGQNNRVYLANPVSVMSLIQLAGNSWKQKEFVESAEEVKQSAAELYTRIRAFLNHFRRVGDTLERSIKSYNDAVGSLELSVLPQARRVHELGATSADVIEPIAPVLIERRALVSSESRQSALELTEEDAP